MLPPNSKRMHFVVVKGSLVMHSQAQTNVTTAWWFILALCEFDIVLNTCKSDQTLA